MGFSKKHQLDGESEANKKWVIAGIAIRAAAPLKSISTAKPKVVDSSIDNDDESCSTTPTAKEARLPTKFSCPPAPRKRRPASTCHGNGVREFFTPPDLESVFIKLVERAN